MPIQPEAALRQRLIFRIHVRDFIQRRLRHERVRDFQINLAHDFQVALDEAVQRLAHAAFGGVLDRNHRVIRFAFFHRRKNIRDRRHRVVIHAGAEFLHRRGVRVARFRPEVRDHQRLLERDGRRHDLTVNRAQRVMLDRALVLAGDFAKHRVFALGHVDLAAGTALDLADLGREREALVDEFDQLPVEHVDLFANRAEFHVRQRVFRFRPSPARARLPRPQALQAPACWPRRPRLRPRSRPPRAIARRADPCRRRSASARSWRFSTTRRSGASSTHRKPATRRSTSCPQIPGSDPSCRIATAARADPPGPRCRSDLVPIIYSRRPQPTRHGSSQSRCASRVDGRKRRRASRGPIDSV